MKALIKVDKPQTIRLYNKKNNIIYKGNIYPSIYLINASTIDCDYTIVNLKLDFIKDFINKIPNREKNVNLKFKDLTIKRDFNTNNFSISTSRKLIKYNPNFLKRHNMSFYDFMFVIGHELGHKLYYTEKNCDYIAFLFVIFNYIDPRFISLNFLKNKNRHYHFDSLLNYYSKNMNEIYSNL